MPNGTPDHVHTLEPTRVYSQVGVKVLLEQTLYQCCHFNGGRFILSVQMHTLEHLSYK